MNCDQTKILIYELNEVPRRLLELYIAKYPNSAFAVFKKEGLVLDTFTKDDGELHPWSTWPTVHRGVYNFDHNIRFINQDLSKSKRFKPIWEILVEKDINIGIFGSLQSYPPILGKNVSFYLPDTFSPDSNAKPEELSQFQSFNLAMVNKNKAISRGISTSQINLLYPLIKKRIVSINGLNSIFLQLIKEKLNSKYKTRRALIQNVLGFDLFLKNLYKNKPTFCTYFTNHVAGMMHRYWRDLFPEDFNLKEHEVDPFHSKSILKSMHLANNDLKKLIKFSKSNNYDLWVISSMGQECIDRGEYIPELYLGDFNSFLSALNLKDSSFELLPAMQPDYCIKCSSTEDLIKLKNLLKDIKDLDGNHLLTERYPPKDNRLNISLTRSITVSLNKQLCFKDKKYSIKQFGLEIIKRDIGTGYHIPQGIFLALGKNNDRLINYQNHLIETNKICPTILDLFNIEIPTYMNSAL